MNHHSHERRRPSWLHLFLLLLAGFAFVVAFPLTFYQPDRPAAALVPGTSAGPAFVVQVIRPRLGLPLAGLLPPHLFGVDAHLGFDSTSAGARIRRVDRGRIELSADRWDFQLVWDGDGRVTAETEVVFDLIFEDRRRTVRCRPGDPVVGTLTILELGESGERSGSFDLELAQCEDAETGTPLGWPPQPLRLHGSFDRLRLNADSK